MAILGTLGGRFILKPATSRDERKFKRVSIIEDLFILWSKKARNYWYKCVIIFFFLEVEMLDIIFNYKFCLITK